MVNCLICVPSANMDYLFVAAPRFAENTISSPSGAHVGSSLRPSPHVNCSTAQFATGVKSACALIDAVWFKNGMRRQFSSEWIKISGCRRVKLVNATFVPSGETEGMVVIDL